MAKPPARPNSHQELFLNAVRRERLPCAVYLSDSRKLSGTVEGFDQFSILLRDGSHQHMIYKHAIVTIAPARPVRLNVADPAAAEAGPEEEADAG